MRYLERKRAMSRLIDFIKHSDFEAWICLADGFPNILYPDYQLVVNSFATVIRRENCHWDRDRQGLAESANLGF